MSDISKAAYQLFMDGVKIDSFYPFIYCEKSISIFPDDIDRLFMKRPSYFIMFYDDCVVVSRNLEVTINNKLFDEVVNHLWHTIDKPTSGIFKYYSPDFVKELCDDIHLWHNDLLRVSSFIKNLGFDKFNQLVDRLLNVKYAAKLIL